MAISVDRIHGVAGDLAIKAPVRVATTANIALSGLQTIDGVVLVDQDRVLVKNQTTGADNGIWVATTSSWSRALDFNGALDVVRGTLVEVVAGTLEAGSVFRLDTDSPVIGTTSLTFTRTHTVNLETDLASTASGKGAALVGFLPTGTGAVATTVGAELNILNQPAGTNFFSEFGAKIQRLRDRVFVGDAAKHNGTNVASQPDWLTTYLLAKGRTFAFQQVTQQAVLTENNQSASNAFLAGARTSPFTGLGNAIGVLGVAVNNNTSFATGAYGAYFEGYQDAGTSGPCYGVEIDTANFANAANTNPYVQAGDQVIGLQLASGAEYPSAGQFAASAAINIRNNGSTYDRGIVFGDTSITGVDGVATATGVAIAFARGHAIQWYAAGGVETSSIHCLGTTAAAGIKQRFTDQQVNWRNSNDKVIAQVFGIDTDVNFPSIRASGTGLPVQFSAQGDDTNIDLQVVPKGTGNIWLGPWTANADAAVNGYMTVKDKDGNVRKLATIA